MKQVECSMILSKYKYYCGYIYDLEKAPFLLKFKSSKQIVDFYKWPWGTAIPVMNPTDNLTVVQV